MAGYVYLVWAKGTDMYKLGSSQYPEKRLPSLQTGSPVELELIASKAFESYEFQEKRMHSHWKQYRVQGEWFRFHPTMLPMVLDGFGVRSKWMQRQIDKAESEAVEIVVAAAKDSLDESLNGLAAVMAEFVKAAAFNPAAKFAFLEARLIAEQVGLSCSYRPMEISGSSKIQP